MSSSSKESYNIEQVVEFQVAKLKQAEIQQAESQKYEIVVVSINMLRKKATDEQYAKCPGIIKIARTI